MRNLKRELRQLKKNGADYIIACMHMGGQYNREPNELTLKVTNKVLKYGADVVIGHHEYVIHKCDVSDKTKIKTYSLGNFSGLAGALKEPYDRLAEYSIIFNLYLGKENNMVSVKKCTFSITKSVANGQGKTKTVLLYDLINNCVDELQYKQLLKNNLKVYNLFLNKNSEEINLEKEYDIC